MAVYNTTNGYMLHLVAGNKPIKSESKTYFVLDRSGSMVGSPWQTIKEVFADAAKYSQDYEQNIILYNSQAHLVPMRDVKKYEAEGTTNFAAPFDIMSKIMRTATMPVSFIFLTDGYDTFGTPVTLDRALKQFSLQVRAGKTATIHTIGFTVNHNRGFLDHIRQLGSTPGAFQYADASLSLAHQINIVADYVDQIAQCKVQVYFERGSGEQSERDEGEGGKQAEKEYLSEISDGNIIVFIKSQKNGRPVKAVCNGTEYQLAEHEPIVYPKLVELADCEINNFDTTNAIQHQLSQCMKEIKSKQPLYTQSVELASLIQEKLNEAFRLLKDNSLNAVEKQNQLLHTSHSVQYKKARRDRLMNKRMIVNQNTLDIESALDKHWEAIPAAAGADGPSCFISLDTLGDVLREQHQDEPFSGKETVIFTSKYDLMGFPVTFARSECIIDAPMLIRINRMSTSNITKLAFEEIVRSKSKDLDKALWETLGGFSSAEAAEVLEDMGREPSNAWLPIYGCEEHFQRVKLVIKPLLGWLFTLNPLGFNNLQYLGLYAILGQMMGISKGFEAHTRIIDDFTKLCRGFLKEAREVVVQHYIPDSELAHIKVQLAKGNNIDLTDLFVKIHKFRRAEYTQSLFMYIGWAMVVGDKSMALQFRLREEIFRRTCYYVYRDSSDACIEELIESVIFEKQDQEAPTAPNSKVAAPAPADTSDAFNDMLHWYVNHIDDTVERVRPLIKLVAELKQQCRDDLMKTRKQKTRKLIFHTTNSAYETVIKHPFHQLLMKAMERWFGPLTELTAAQVTNLTAYGLHYYHNKRHNAADMHEPIREDPAATAAFLEPLKAKYELNDKRSDDAAFEALCANELAKIALTTPSLSKFVGLCITECPTRGSLFFRCLFDQLSSGAGAYPSLLKKLTYLVSGKFGKNNVPFLSDGTPYVGCDREKRIAKAALIANGDDYETFCKKTDLGTFGHVYRASDIPNRHGYHRSHPNPALSYTIKWMI